MLKLIIDTSNSKETIVGLSFDNDSDIRTVLVPKQGAQLVLPLIDNLLKEHKKKLTDITAVVINSGPGSFTGIRVGLSIANTIATLCEVPVNDRKPGEPERAVYK